MKKVFVLLYFTGICAGCMAQVEGFGLGLILGNPTGLSAKMWTSKKTAIDGALAWAIFDNGYFQLHSDILSHTSPIRIGKGEMPLYLGLGARLRFSDQWGSLTELDAIGIRLPLGLAYHFGSTPIDLFFEIAPVLDIIGDQDLTVHKVIGIRSYLQN